MRACRYGTNEIIAVHHYKKCMKFSLGNSFFVIFRGGSTTSSHTTNAKDGNKPSAPAAAGEGSFFLGGKDAWAAGERESTQKTRSVY